MWASLVVKVVHIPKFAYIIITKELESWNTEGDKILHLLDSSSLNSHVGVVFKVGLVCHNRTAWGPRVHAQSSFGSFSDSSCSSWLTFAALVPRALFI
jgi:hypothetical protein